MLSLKFKGFLRSLRILSEGFHLIKIEDANLCINEIEVYITNKCISLIKEAVFNDENKMLEVWPNPASDFLNIKYDKTFFNDENASFRLLRYMANFLSILPRS